MKKLISIITIIVILSVLFLNRKLIQNYIDYSTSNSDTEYGSGFSMDKLNYGIPTRVFINKLETISDSQGYLSDFFTLPDMRAQKSYEVNDQLDFVINNDYLGYEPEIFENIVFWWNFGDGITKIGGSTESHRFSTPGSYVISIALLGSADEVASISEANYANQLSYAKIKVNIVQDKSYRLPEATLLGLINPYISNNHYIQVIFNAKESDSSTKLNYFLDYGDGDYSFYPASAHTFYADKRSTYVTLRVTDKHGFFSDENTSIHFKESKELNLVQNYKVSIYRHLESKLNDTLYRFSESKINLLAGVFVLGFSHIISTPLLAIFIFIFGYRKGKSSFIEHFNFLSTKNILHFFYLAAFSLLTLYVEPGLIIVELFSKVLLVMGLLLLINETLVVFFGNKNNMKLSPISVLLVLLPLPLAFSTFALAYYYHGVFDALYLLCIYIIGSTTSYQLVLCLGIKTSSFFKKLRGL